MATQRRKYVPRPTGLHQQFFHAVLAEEGLVVQTCGDCGAAQHPPRRYCRSCASRNLAFEPASGNGTVFSWTVSHHTTDPGWADDLPYATVVIDTEEGPRIVGSYSGDASELRAGLPVTVRPEPKSDDFAYFWFDPA